MEDKIEKIATNVGRPKKEIAEGRVRLSTLLQPNLIMWLKIQAVENHSTLADMLENAVNMYKYEKERNR
jgi:hypothetical protein